MKSNALLSAYKKLSAPQLMQILLDPGAQEDLINLLIFLLLVPLGLITVWNSSIFEGILIDSQQFELVIKFISKLNAEVWTLVNVYGPCDQRRDAFVQ